MGVPSCHLSVADPALPQTSPEHPGDEGEPDGLHDFHPLRLVQVLGLEHLRHEEHGGQLLGVPGGSLQGAHALGYLVHDDLRQMATLTDSESDSKISDLHCLVTSLTLSSVSSLLFFNRTVFNSLN